MIRLEPISPENLKRLSLFRPRRNKANLSHPIFTLSPMAKVYPECVALAAFDNDQAVGFAMYCPDRADGESGSGG